MSAQRKKVVFNPGFLPLQNASPELAKNLLRGGSGQNVFASFLGKVCQGQGANRQIERRVGQVQMLETAHPKDASWSLLPSHGEHLLGGVYAHDGVATLG